MRYEYIAPFVESTRTVLQSVLGTTVTSGGTSLVPGGVVSGDVLIIVHVSGDSEGNLILSMSDPTAERVCAALGGPEGERLDMIAELANMITGQATSRLCDEGHDFTVHPPLVIAAENLREKTPGVEMISIPVTSECGELRVNVAMKTN